MREAEVTVTRRKTIAEVQPQQAHMARIAKPKL